MTSRSRSSLVALGALFLSVAWVGPAAAAPSMPCINPTVSSNLVSGSAGTAVTLQGRSFGQGEVVELKWNLQAQSLPDAPVLATATGPEFSVPVTIPAASADGAYWIVAVTASDQTFNAAMDFYVGIPPVAGETQPAEEVQPPVAAADPAPIHEGTAGSDGEPASTRPKGSDPQQTVVPATSREDLPVAAASLATPAGVGNGPAATRVLDVADERPATRIGPMSSLPPSHHLALERGVIVERTDRSTSQEEMSLLGLGPSFGSAYEQTPGAAVMPSLETGVGLLASGLVLLLAGFLGAQILSGRRPSERYLDAEDI